MSIGAHVGFGSLGDMPGFPGHVRITPDGGHSPRQLERPLGAISRHMGRRASIGRSALRRNRPQDVLENAGLHLKRLRAVVLVVSGGHRDDEIELRHDANRLPASTKRGGPVDLTPLM